MINIILITNTPLSSCIINTNISIHYHPTISSAYPDLKQLSVDLLILDESVCHDGIFSGLEDIRSIKKVPIWLITTHNDNITRLASSKLGVINQIAPFNKVHHLYDYIINYSSIINGKASTKLTNSDYLIVDKLIYNENELSVQFDGGKWVKLQPKQGSILKYMMSHPDTTISVEDIIQSCFGYNPTMLDPSDLKLVRTQISVLRTTLRRASIEKADASQYIKTEVNRGYKFLSTLI